MDKQIKPRKYKYVFKHVTEDVTVTFQSGDIPEAIKKLGNHVNSVIDWRMRRFKLKSKKI